MKKSAASPLSAGTPVGTPGLPPRPALPSVPLPPGTDPLLVNIPEPQRTMVQQLATRTGLTIAFSIQCLEGNGWDPESAFANFEAVKTTIPPEGFAQ